jgi:hypothetical protein
MTRSALALATFVLCAPMLLQAQARAERLHVYAADPTVTEFSAVLRASGSVRALVSGGVESRGDTLRFRPVAGRPVVLELPSGAFELELRALAGQPALHAELAPATADEPAHVTATGPVVRARREASGAFSLGAGMGRSR